MHGPVRAELKSLKYWKCIAWHWKVSVFWLKVKWFWFRWSSKGLPKISHFFKIGALNKLYLAKAHLHATVRSTHLSPSSLTYFMTDPLETAFWKGNIDTISLPVEINLSHFWHWQLALRPKKVLTTELFFRLKSSQILKIVFLKRNSRHNNHAVRRTDH